MSTKNKIIKSIEKQEQIEGFVKNIEFIKIKNGYYRKFHIKNNILKLLEDIKQ